MNKMIIDKENIKFKDEVIKIELNINKLTIDIEGNVTLNEISTKEENLTLNINLKPNSKLIFNRFKIDKNSNIEINLIQEENSILNFNYSSIIKDKTNIKVNSILKGDNNTTNINIKAVTEENGKCEIASEADIKPNIKDNKLLESIRVVLLNDEESIVLPNLLVSSNEVEVNHAATLSGIDKEYLFYLNSKGISEKNAINLIKKGYLLNNLEVDNTIKEEINNMI
ncbi:MAG: SufD family Fe-S cluster assembly protein [Bacilli bacterium]|nr:SufD family Fe-S cluster assembly protein [Bacilli bacterium]